MTSIPKFLKPEEIDVLRRYHKRGCTEYVKCKVDQVNLDLNTSKEHRRAILKRATKAVDRNERYITEAVPNDPKRRRRIDFVSLTFDREEEFETDHKIKKKGAVTHYV